MEQLIGSVAMAAASMKDQVYYSNNQFIWADYLVFSVFLVGSAAIGIYFSMTGGRQKTTTEYLMGDRSMQLVPVSISILVSFTSAILILGSPAEIYLNGIIYFYYVIGMMLACIISAYTFVPLFFPLKMTSSFEYLEERFGSRAVRIVGNLLYILKGIVYMGIAMYAPSTAMEQVTGKVFKKEYAIVMSGVIGTFYTMLGGLKAVVWTDVFQAGVMISGVFGIFIRAAVDAGGFGSMYYYAEKYDRIVWWEGSPDPTERHTMWGLIIGSAIGWVYTMGVNQASVQRFSSLPSLAKAKWSVLLNVPGSLILTWGSCFMGLAIFGYYASIGCDIYGAGWVGKNQIVPYYVMDRMAVPCFPGLFVAALFSGALSSISSSLNACSAIVWKDILQPFSYFSRLSERTATIITKALVLLFGILGTGMGFIATSLGGTVLQASLSFSGATGGPSLGLFLLGALFPFVNWVGGLVGPIVGVTLSMWVSIGAYSSSKQEVEVPADTSRCNYTVLPPTRDPTAMSATLPPGLDAWYSISYLWYPAVGVFTTIIVGVIVSLIASLFGVQTKTHRKFVFPLVYKLFNSLPKGCMTTFNITFIEDDDNDDENDSKNNVTPFAAKSDASVSSEEAAGKAHQADGSAAFLADKNDEQHTDGEAVDMTQMAESGSNAGANKNSSVSLRNRASGGLDNSAFVSDTAGKSPTDGALTEVQM
ncbi:hypothetical protein BOX15_Mlig031137g1 [Macrostomum lignano]|uniref:Sodium-coupled monocarboxylate transporter 1 n=1 Tax=Macrostomum lignano TaxID=282301 RepID=A0A267FZL9_9PLAT|nr:hypothetical protein BOX15_Mlig003234g1 [Macrostomum lignano]PAA79285.1 hypothetical protein BOX15_Mlig031137g1 [Macrostomum lignano]